MKYAVIESGGKQYLAREGETLEVDRLPAAAGQAVHFQDVLLAADGDLVLVGAPHVAGAGVHATVQAEVRGPKILVFRYAPKKRRRKRMGHRSIMTRLRVDTVSVPGGQSPSATVEAGERPAPAATRRTPATRASKPPASGKPKAARPARPAAKPAAKKPPAKSGKK